LLKSKLNEIQPDIIVTTTSAELSLINKLKGNIPLVVESHEGYSHIGYTSSMTWLHRWNIRRRYRLLHKANVIVSLTESDAQKWRKHYPHVQIIPNVVHLNPTGRLSDLTQKRVIFVARLAEQKGIPELTAIWRITHQRHPDWVLEMYGDGDNAYMNQMAEGMRAFSPVSDIFSKYCESSILILTSRWEPFGLVLPEAMSCGLPVVSFEGDGPNSIITDSVDGFIICKRDIGVFSDRLCQLIEDKELRLRMGQAAIQSAQRYEPERIIPLWKDLFESLLRK
jgi:glycosyltransferase involved in cell wall biosynthesis